MGQLAPKKCPPSAGFFMHAKQSFQKLSLLNKVLTTVAAGFVSLAAIGSGAYATYTHFQTDSEAITAREIIVRTHATDRVSDRQARENDRIDRLERENTRYERSLLNPDLPEYEREFLLRQIDKNDEKIKCIRAEQC